CPKHLAESAPRDVLLRAHYYHVKEILLKSSRTAVLPTDYACVKIFVDLSAAMLRRHKTFHQVTATLRDNNIRYSWGYPTKLLITKNGTLTLLQTREEGLKISPTKTLPASPDPGMHSHLDG
ncbi:Hypothetical predicted protein, partial [Pelobates cultripes]